MNKRGLLQWILVAAPAVLAIGVMTVFRACSAKEDGTWMHCHEVQTALAITGVILTQTGRDCCGSHRGSSSGNADEDVHDGHNEMLCGDAAVCVDYGRPDRTAVAPGSDWQDQEKNKVTDTWITAKKRTD